MVQRQIKCLNNTFQRTAQVVKPFGTDKSVPYEHTGVFRRECIYAFRNLTDWKRQVGWKKLQKSIPQDTANSVPWGMPAMPQPWREYNTFEASTREERPRRAIPLGRVILAIHHTTTMGKESCMKVLLNSCNKVNSYIQTINVSGNIIGLVVAVFTFIPDVDIDYSGYILGADLCRNNTRSYSGQNYRYITSRHSGGCCFCDGSTVSVCSNFVTWCSCISNGCVDCNIRTAHDSYSQGFIELSRVGISRHCYAFYLQILCNSAANIRDVIGSRKIIPSIVRCTGSSRHSINIGKDAITTSYSICESILVGNSTQFHISILFSSTCIGKSGFCINPITGNNTV